MQELTTPTDTEMDVTDDSTIDDQQTTDEQIEETSQATLTEDDIWDADDDSYASMLDADNKQEVEQDVDDSQLDEEPQQELVQPEVTQEQGLIIKNPVLKFKGRDIPIESEDELINLAQKGMKLESEMNKIKPQKRLLQIIEGVDENKLVMFKDALDGNKGAIDLLAKELGIQKAKVKNNDDFFNSYEDDEEVQPEPAVDYKPNIQTSDPVRDWFNEYSGDNPSSAGKVVEVVKDIDPVFYKEIYNETIFPSFVQHIDNGTFDKVYPTAIKIKATNPNVTWIMAYNMGVDRVFGQQRQQPSAPAQATVTKSTVKPKQVRSDSYDAVWDDDDMYKELLKQNRY